MSKARASLPLVLYIDRFLGGVFSKRRIPKRTQFGPLEGPLVSQSQLQGHYIHLKVRQHVLFIFLLNVYLLYKCWILRTLLPFPSCAFWTQKRKQRSQATCGLTCLMRTAVIGWCLWDLPRTILSRTWWPISMVLKSFTQPSRISNPNKSLRSLL